MKDQNLFAHVNLVKGERSELSELASNLMWYLYLEGGGREGFHPLFALLFYFYCVKNFILSNKNARVSENSVSLHRLKQKQ